MRLSSVLSSLSLSLFLMTACQTPDGSHLADYVNPFIGASTSVGKAGIYHGLGSVLVKLTGAGGNGLQRDV